MPSRTVPIRVLAGPSLRIGIVALAASFLLSPASGADSPLRFDERSLSFAEVDQGVKAKGVVRFRNAGSRPVQLKGVAGDCSCVVGQFPKTTIAPGAEGMIDVSIATAQRIGQYKATLTIDYEVAGKKAVDKVTVAVFVRAEGKLVAQPESLYFAGVEAGGEAKAQIEIRHVQYARQPTLIRSVSAPRWLKTELRQMPGPEPIWHLAICGRVPEGSGLVYDNIVIATDSERFPQLEVPVVLMLEGEFVREPRSLVQILRFNAAVSSSHLTVRHAKGLPWSIERVDLHGLSEQQVHVDKGAPGASIEKTIAVTPIQPDNKSFSALRGAMVIGVRLQGRSETVRVPLLFIWKD